MAEQSWRCRGDGQTLCRQWDGCRASQGSAWGWKGRRRVQRDRAGRKASHWGMGSSGRKIREFV